MQKNLKSAALFSFAFLLPFQCFSQNKDSFQATVNSFASPAHCAWFSGVSTQGDGIPSSYSAHMVQAMEAGNKAGMTNASVLSAIDRACASKTVVSAKNKS